MTAALGVIHLKPCPFCGSQGEVAQVQSAAPGYPFAAVVRCTECHTAGLGVTIQDAARAACEGWNRRPDDEAATLREDVKRLRAGLLRELSGADRAVHECARQGAADWGRHFERMRARVAKVLEQGDGA